MATDSSKTTIARCRGREREYSLREADRVVKDEVHPRLLQKFAHKLDRDPDSMYHTEESSLRQPFWLRTTVLPAILAMLTTSYASLPRLIVHGAGCVRIYRLYVRTGSSLNYNLLTLEHAAIWPTFGVTVPPTNPTDSLSVTSI